MGDTLRTLRLWTEEEWLAMPAAKRPGTAKECPGIGWISAGPIRLIDLC